MTWLQLSPISRLSRFPVSAGTFGTSGILLVHFSLAFSPRAWIEIFASNVLSDLLHLPAAGRSIDHQLISRTEQPQLMTQDHETTRRRDDEMTWLFECWASWDMLGHAGPLGAFRMSTKTSGDLQECHRTWRWLWMVNNGNRCPWQLGSTWENQMVCESTLRETYWCIFYCIIWLIIVNS